MKSELRFETQKIKMAELGAETSTPELLGAKILQNDLESSMDVEKEIRKGYGRIANAYPYCAFSCYQRELKDQDIKTAVLENDYLKAVFLPELGGRLWSLWDKIRGRELLFRNPAIRFGNLAIRNAWFSGGVEWNVGVIGHSPFTTCPLFAAELQMKNGTPVLRMYEFERIRKVTWQMDFWLGNEDRFLNARMRIVNIGDQETPMYWWSNIAVPDYENGRILVPAKTAYTYQNGHVYKTEIPLVDGIDISKYHEIPCSVDYFFDLPEEEPKYIAHVGEDGYGLLQMSTGRLLSRKLFSWGKKRAASHWQEFLSEGDGKYVEIQAGITKTQYGCIPMPPHAVWEWLERYGAAQLEDTDAEANFSRLRTSMTDQVRKDPFYQEMERTLADTEELAVRRGKMVQKGSGYGALKNALRKRDGGELISEYLDFGEVDEEMRTWVSFLETGKFPTRDAAERPDTYMDEDVFYGKLKETIQDVNRENWYAHYHLGIYHYRNGLEKAAFREFESSVKCCENPWGYYGMAVAALALENLPFAADAAVKGIELRNHDLGYLKEAFRILDLCGAFKETIHMYEGLDAAYQKNGRLSYYYVRALCENGDVLRARELLNAGGGLVVEDIREGELSLGDLWKTIEKKLGQDGTEVPYVFDFEAV